MVQSAGFSVLTELFHPYLNSGLYSLVDFRWMPDSVFCVELCQGLGYFPQHLLDLPSDHFFSQTNLLSHTYEFSWRNPAEIVFSVDLHGEFLSEIGIDGRGKHVVCRRKAGLPSPI